MQKRQRACGFALLQAYKDIHIKVEKKLKLRRFCLFGDLNDNPLNIFKK